jgi:phytoene synthase
LWDKQGRKYETLEDIYDYAARVAGTVGAMMALIMGVRSHQALARACELGLAMQLTNIARDVGEDVVMAVYTYQGPGYERWVLILIHGE